MTLTIGYSWTRIPLQHGRSVGDGQSCNKYQVRYSARGRQCLQTYVYKHINMEDLSNRFIQPTR